MASVINQYSFLLAGVAALALLAALLFRDGIKSGDFLALGALTLGIALAYGLLRPGQGTANASDTIRAEIGKGTPVLLEFQSPF
jgi:hypothetical protein